MPLFYAYRAATRILGPIVGLYLHRRKNRGKEDPGRIGERFGHPGHRRPDGPLVWIHGASVGESLSALPVIDRLQRDYPEFAILVTTGTVTSARMMHERLPQNVIHQFIPVDRQVYVARFLHHWRPDVALWLESDLWPNILTRARKAGTKIALLNGRISEGSFKSYRRFPSFIRPVMACFSVVLAQTDTEAARFIELGAPNVITTGNLKFAALPLPVEDKILRKYRDQIGDRPVWLASSTFEGEESIAASIHARLREKHRNLLTIIVPRHPNRATGVEATLMGKGLRVARRSMDHIISRDTDVFLGDTIGEMGLYYRLAPICFIGKTLCVGGGQNPLEPARLGCAILHGPDMSNFAEISQEMLSEQAARPCTDEADLERQLDQLLTNQPARDALTDAARNYANSKAEVLERTMSAINDLMVASRGPHARP
ncbi:3-deoxy-D-manno-octulosonic acid transferase [Thalassospira sp. TSL5-1]|uniref:3-deoxy-D-manno-octulosonic acid transferase n=1 Tax=Thalassospira sp. TSL5-1 TaxID=1544451 RepID=UPI0009391296|nr:3-deoxy-D-manno-octulosonic acid transferase [Thalassospira sp. TSL5-1]OKH88905.1 3-deoxy-D-manno-octulosonic acid transferase [Thalassospira sp. TSL5-1]